MDQFDTTLHTFRDDPAQRSAIISEVVEHEHIPYLAALLTTYSTVFDPRVDSTSDVIILAASYTELAGDAALSTLLTAYDASEVEAFRQTMAAMLVEFDDERIIPPLLATIVDPWASPKTRLRMLKTLRPYLDRAEVRAAFVDVAGQTIPDEAEPITHPAFMAAFEDLWEYARRALEETS